MLNMQKMPSTFCAFSWPIDSLPYLTNPNTKSVRMKGLVFAYRLLEQEMRCAFCSELRYGEPLLFRKRSGPNPVARRMKNAKPRRSDDFHSSAHKPQAL